MSLQQLAAAKVSGSRFQIHLQYRLFTIMFMKNSLSYQMLPEIKD